jgi:hypothetical protein
MERHGGVHPTTARGVRESANCATNSVRVQGRRHGPDVHCRTTTPERGNRIARVSQGYRKRIFKSIAKSVPPPWILLILALKTRRATEAGGRGGSPMRHEFSDIDADVRTSICRRPQNSGCAPRRRSRERTACRTPIGRVGGVRNGARGVRQAVARNEQPAASRFNIETPPPDAKPAPPGPAGSGPGASGAGLSGTGMWRRAAGALIKDRAKN